MKKILGLILFLFLLVSCASVPTSSQPTEPRSNDEIVQMPEPGSPEGEPTSPEPTQPEPTQAPTEEAPVVTQDSEVKLENQPVSNNIHDYFPFIADYYKYFEGDGNEFATFDMFVQYMDENRIQYLTRNGGTQVVTVYEKLDNEIKVVFTQPEVYYREKMLDRTGSIGTYLRGPVEVGTTWVNVHNQEMTITDVNVMIDGVSSIEVQTVSDTFYYGYKKGLVKEILNRDSFPVVSTLVKEQVGQPIDVQYTLFTYKDNKWVNNDIVTPMMTNDIFRLRLSEEFVKYDMFPEDTIINSLYKNRTDDRIYVDVSSTIYNDLNSKVEEERRLQSIVRTIGGIYNNADQVYFWVDGLAYQGPFVQMAKNELLKITP